MNFDSVNNKQLQEIERLAKELLVAMRKAHMGDEPLCKELARLAEQAGGVRVSRYDEADNGYKGY